MVLDHLLDIINPVVVFPVNLVVQDRLQKLEDLNPSFAQGVGENLPQQNVHQQVQVIFVEIVLSNFRLLEHYVQGFAAFVKSVQITSVS